MHPIRHTISKMYNFVFDPVKNEKLKAERKVSFEMVMQAIDDDRLLATIEHPNSDKYNNQKMFIVEINCYAYAVPFVENEKEIALKTIFPSRKMTKIYLNKDESEELC